MADKGINVLAETFRQVGAEAPRVELNDVLYYAPNDPRLTKAVYDNVNRTLLEVISKHPLDRMVHVTSHMRALSEPIHRKVVKTNWWEHGRKGVVVCAAPESVEKGPREFVSWLKDKWPKDKSNWRDELGALRTLADGRMEMRFAPPEKLQFSVFGDEYVLLQSVHPEDHHYDKHVWLVRSNKLGDQLAARAQEVAKGARTLPAAYFSTYVDSVLRPRSVGLLSEIRKRGIYPNENQSERDQETLGDYELLGFVKRGADGVSIQPPGERFLAYMERLSD